MTTAKQLIDYLKSIRSHYNRRLFRNEEYWEEMSVYYEES
jgi:hypothetical protein